MKHFYTHIIEIDSVYTALDDLELNDEEKAELQYLVQTHVHHTVIDTVMSELSEEEKKKFLKHLAKEDHESMWQHLRGNILDVEEKIKRSVETLKQALHNDIRTLREKS